MARLTSPLAAGVGALLGLLFLHSTPAAADDGMKLDYCSSFNTKDTDAYFWTWQSNGWCKDKCMGDYAFAIVQNLDCWCSNYMPGETSDTDDCDKKCPGYPSERCGSQDGTKFGYIALGKEPSGTRGGSQSTSSKEVSSTSSSILSSTSSSERPASTKKPTPSSAPPSSVSRRPKETHRDPDPATVVETVIESGSVVTLTPSDKSTSEQSTLKTTTSDDVQSATSKQVITTSGPGGISVITQTVIYRPTNLPSEGEQKSSSNTGAIVGGVVGGIAVIAALVGGIVFLLWRRRRQRQQQEMGEVDEFGVQRHTSTMSKAGLLRGEKSPRQPPTALATNIRRNSRMMADSDSASPGSGHSNDRRSSRPYIFDQRLNPSAIMMQDNTSRGSFVSLDDAADYHRTLNVRNPDPEDADPESHTK